MKLSLKWLSDHVEVQDFFADPELLGDKLTAVGLELEGIERADKGLEKVVVGQITKLGKHPDADKLTYCDVSIGDESLKIVCGAKNHKEGDKVAVAVVGAVLPGNFKIKKSKIRGVESFGMLCSGSELGLSEESEGILILDKDAIVGSKFSEVYELDDVILEINVTPNRADCLSHLGLAREVSSIFDRPLKERKLSPLKEYSGEEKYSIDLEDTENCPRYMGRAMYGVQVKESPDWLKKRLESVGLNPINNVVDVTNYIMMDSGQPLHAFDLDKLNDSKILISPSKDGESFETLDGTLLKLSGEELTIRDGKGPVALAGVIGGKNSGVSENTRNILVEAAHFKPASVRKTSRRYGVETDSSYRFTRGTDENRVPTCLDEALSLLNDLAGGEVGRSLTDAYPAPSLRPSIDITKDQIVTRLGYEISTDEINKIFKTLRLKVNENSQEVWSVESPSYRWDISIKEDLIEEIGRIKGYDEIPEILPSVAAAPQALDSEYEKKIKVTHQMSSLGFNEAVHYNFYSSKQESSWGEEILNWSKGADEKKLVGIQNPLSEDMAQMRFSCVPQFYSNYVRNFRMGNKTGQIFELGKSHYNQEAGFKENNLLSIALWNGEKNSSIEDVLRQFIGVVEAFFFNWKVSNWKFDMGKDLPSLFHPSYSGRVIVEGKDIGFFYALHPRVGQDDKVSGNFLGIEIDLDAFFIGKPRLPKFKSFSRFPQVERDFSAILKKDFIYQDVVKKLKKSAGRFFKGIELHEVYQGEKIPEGKVSVTFRVKLQSSEGTLDEANLTKVQEVILKDLKSLE